MLIWKIFLKPTTSVQDLSPPKLSRSHCPGRLAITALQHPELAHPGLAANVDDIQPGASIYEQTKHRRFPLTCSVISSLSCVSPLSSAEILAGQQAAGTWQNTIICAVVKVTHLVTFRRNTSMLWADLPQVSHSPPASGQEVSLQRTQYLAVFPTKNKTFIGLFFFKA